MWAWALLLLVRSGCGGNNPNTIPYNLVDPLGGPTSVDSDPAPSGQCLTAIQTHPQAYRACERASCTCLLGDWIDGRCVAYTGTPGCNVRKFCHYNLTRCWQEWTTACDGYLDELCIVGADACGTVFCHPQAASVGLSWGWVLLLLLGAVGVVVSVCAAVACKVGRTRTFTPIRDEQQPIGLNREPSGGRGGVDAWPRWFVGEFIGNFVASLIGFMCVLQQTQLVLQGIVPTAWNNGALSLGISFGFTMGILVSHGGQLNFAFTLALAFSGNVQWRRVPLLFAAQLLSSMVAACTVFGLMEPLFRIPGTDVLTHPIPKTSSTLIIFSSMPADRTANAVGFAASVLYTFFIVLAIIPIFSGSTHLHHAGGATVIGLLVMAVSSGGGGSSLGTVTNPTADLGGRLFCCIAGWGTKAFTDHSHWWWIPVVAPCLGSLLGAMFLRTCGAVGRAPQ